jgi:hypothetical protein
VLDGEGFDLPATADVVALRARIERFVSGTGCPRNRRLIGGNLVQLRHLIDLLEMTFAQQAAEFAASNEHEDWGSNTAIDWIRHHCQMSGTQAADRIVVGEQLSSLPKSGEAVAEGEIGYAHLSLIVHTAVAVVKSPFNRQQVEEQLLSRAMDMSVGAFRYFCQHVRHAAAPEDVNAEQVEAVEQRKLRFYNWEKGVVSISGQMDAAAAALVKTALLSLSRKQGEHDYRHRDRRLMDALVESFSTKLNRPSLQVTASLETLMALAGAPAGELEFSPPISGKTVERFGCDCTLTRVLLDSESMVIDVGRAKRVISGPMRKALQVRDKHCRWPGCERPASYCEGHHLIHWSKNGPTDLKNVVLLCYRHHWMVHEGGWDLIKTADGQLLVAKPLRKLFDHQPRAPGVQAA